MILPAPSTIRAAVPNAKLTGPSSLFTTIVLPGAYVVTVPSVDVVVVAVVVVPVTGFTFVLSVVVVLVCANAIDAIIAQASVIMLFFIFPSVVELPSDLIQGRAADKMRPCACFNCKAFPQLDENRYLWGF